MKLFLVSDSIISVRENGIKIKTLIDESNSFFDNLKKYIKKYENFVFICNNSSDFEHNKSSIEFMQKAFKEQLKPFKNCFLLDERTKKDAKKILSNADFVFLQAGKIPYQNQYLKDIDFAKIITKTDAVVVGKSAGAMNMGYKIFNYPEEESEVNDQKWYTGLELSDFIIIPHFNLETGNKYCGENYNLLNDYFLPASKTNKFHALTDGAYILIDNDISTVYGESYIIENGKVKKLCADGKKKVLTV